MIIEAKGANENIICNLTNIEAGDYEEKKNSSNKKCCRNWKEAIEMQFNVKILSVRVNDAAFHVRHM